MKRNFNIVSVIRKKRDGRILEAGEIRHLIEAYTNGSVPDYQFSAFLMAAFLNGLNEDETAALTESMLHSGIVVDLSEIAGKKVDKHSTGGVGDKLSLILAPIVAAAGVPVPMISGRGLGHTGGTLDKLESIPGFSVNADLKRYKEILKKHNLVLIGQTAEIAPADKKIYALRDVTATVESIPLIAGSIMSKKLAEGIDALVLDVKYGAGAFMKTEEEAKELAATLVGIGRQFGKETIAYLTRMDEPLGFKIGNWLEVDESIEVLKGGGPEDVKTLSHLLSGTMIYLGGRARTIEEGIEISRKMVADGKAFEKWLDIVEEQGGETRFIKNPETYPKASYEFEIKAGSSGYIETLDAFGIGSASVELGAGRRVKEDPVDAQAGIVLNKKIGSKIAKGETIMTGFTNKADRIEPASSLLYDSVAITERKPEIKPLITYIADDNGIRPFKD